MIEFNNEVYDLEMSFSRKCLHEDLDNAFYDLYEPTEEMEAELQQAHDLISAQDAKGLDSITIGMSDIRLNLVKQENMIVEVLKEANYQVEESNVSRSIYAINDNGEEVRISDHKRPAYQVEGAVGYTDHQYDNELIVDDNKVTKAQLIAAGFSRLGSEEYFLG